MDGSFAVAMTTEVEIDFGDDDPYADTKMTLKLQILIVV